ncbi:DUF2971 domain-containing protein [uncultured Polaribacter sp.]|uniref:DUF2971 domain-containing protein n=1 Tax=uncultured Polaribacter sp. TaxID=174711 RepID=UPI00259B0CBE|nr:DUF2971 domain-containing protein [uncultured Polaribacter sp.]
MFKEKNIFQYGNSQFLKNVLENNTIGFSSLKEFNDPFESCYSYNHYVKNVETAFQYVVEMNNGPISDKVSRLRNLIENSLSKFKITCFSKTPYEPLMWAHYAEKHRGICYCFNKDEGIFNMLKYKGKQVTYSNLLPKIDYFDDRTTYEMIKPQIESIILTKSEKWNYEKEFRYYTVSSENTHYFNPKSLQAVIIGCRNTCKEKTKKVIDFFNKKNGTDVKLLFAKISPDEYRMNIFEKEIQRKPSITLPQYDFKDEPIK